MFVWGMGGKEGPSLTKTTATGYPNKTSDPNKNQRVLSGPKKPFRNSLFRRSKKLSRHPRIPNTSTCCGSISTKERKHVSQSKRRHPRIEINLQIYRYRSESESVRFPSRKDEHTLYRLPACVRCTSSSNSNSNSNSNNTDLPHTKKSRK